MIVSGENRLTYGADTGNSLFNMYGDLIITGKGSVEIATPQVGCTNLTVKDGAKLILAAGLITDENVTVDNAEIEAPNAYLNLGNKWDKSLVRDERCSKKPVSLTLFILDFNSF